MNKRLPRLIAAGLIAAGTLGGGVARADLIQNGGFESSSSFDGWQQFGSSDYNLVASEADYVLSGTNAAFFGESGGNGGIAQTLTTVQGRAYKLTFSLGNMGGSDDNADTVSSFALFVGSAATPTFFMADKTATGYTPYSFEFTASDASTELKFEFRQDENFWFLDDVAVDAAPVAGTVPEPGALLLLLAAFAALAISRGKRISFRREH